MRSVTLFFVVSASAGLLALAGCATSPEPITAPAPAAEAADQEQRVHARHADGQSDAEDGASGMCPMKVAGTTVAVVEFDGGVALEFTTTGDVAELRQRVQHMVGMHEQHQASGMERGQEGMHATMPPSEARSEAIEGGARLVLTPQQPEQLDALREHAHRHAQQMATGRCPMMESMGQTISDTNASGGGCCAPRPIHGPGEGE